MFLSSHAQKCPLSYLLIHDIIDKERVHDVRLELRMDVSVTDFLMEQLTDGALMLGADLLGFVGDIELGNFVGAFVGLETAGKHPDHRRLARSVLAEHDDNFRVAEFALLHRQTEFA